MNVSRRGLLRGIMATAAASAAPTVLVRAVEEPSKPRLDPDLILLFSDCHVNGHLDRYEQHERPALKDTLERILRLDPLPAQAIFFGDLAYLWGHREDYALARELLKPLADAGIKLTIGMGNHDRRSTFLDVFPEYAKTTRIPGKVVSVVDAGAVAFIMLDGLQGTDDRKLDDGGPGNGALCEAQQEWLKAELPKCKKPVFVCSHWPTGNFKICGEALHKFLMHQPMVAGYIHGHDHRWRKNVEWESWKSPRLLKTLCLPSTGHWGDIGFALMRVTADAATVSLCQHDFYFPSPNPQEPGANFEMWRQITEENRNLKCSFTLPHA